MYLNKLKWIEKDGYCVNINNIYTFKLYFNTW